MAWLAACCTTMVVPVVAWAQQSGGIQERRTATFNGRVYPLIPATASPMTLPDGQSLRPLKRLRLKSADQMQMDKLSREDRSHLRRRVRPRRGPTPANSVYVGPGSTQRVGNSPRSELRDFANNIDQGVGQVPRSWNMMDNWTLDLDPQDLHFVEEIEFSFLSGKQVCPATTETWILVELFDDIALNAPQDSGVNWVPGQTARPEPHNEECFPALGPSCTDTVLPSNEGLAKLRYHLGGGIFNFGALNTGLFFQFIVNFNLGSLDVVDAGDGITTVETEVPGKLVSIESGFHDDPNTTFSLPFTPWSVGNETNVGADGHLFIEYTVGKEHKSVSGQFQKTGRAATILSDNSNVDPDAGFSANGLYYDSLGDANRIQENNERFGIVGINIANETFRLSGVGASDCNTNGQLDELEISGGSVADANSNGFPDECEICSNGVCAGCGGGWCGDCNTNGVSDIDDISGATSTDCNSNFIPDDCDVASGKMSDCDTNGTPDDCEFGVSGDCNANLINDGCEIATHRARDCNSNGIPDRCSSELLAGDNDCNGNRQPDECDLVQNFPGTGDVSNDCNFDGIPDDCQPDCDGNGAADDCDLLLGVLADLNGDGIPDPCNAPVAIWFTSFELVEGYVRGTVDDQFNCTDPGCPGEGREGDPGWGSNFQFYDPSGLLQTVEDITDTGLSGACGDQYLAIHNGAFDDGCGGAGQANCCTETCNGCAGIGEDLIISPEWLVESATEGFPFQKVTMQVRLHNIYRASDQKFTETWFEVQTQGDTVLNVRYDGLLNKITWTNGLVRQEAAAAVPDLITLQSDGWHTLTWIVDVDATNEVTLESASTGGPVALGARFSTEAAIQNFVAAADDNRDPTGLSYENFELPADPGTDPSIHIDCVDVIADGAPIFEDCDNNGLQDACPDWQTNGPFSCDNSDIARDGVDCNSNGTPDFPCDVTPFAGAAGGCDCDGNNVPDECQLPSAVLDANSNGTIDDCETSYAYGFEILPDGTNIEGFTVTGGPNGSAGIRGQRGWNHTNNVLTDFQEVFRINEETNVVVATNASLGISASPNPIGGGFNPNDQVLQMRSGADAFNTGLLGFPNPVAFPEPLPSGGDDGYTTFGPVGLDPVYVDFDVELWEMDYLGTNYDPETADFTTVIDDSCTFANFGFNFAVRHRFDGQMEFFDCTNLGLCSWVEILPLDGSGNMQPNVWDHLTVEVHNIGIPQQVFVIIASDPANPGLAVVPTGFADNREIQLGTDNRVGVTATAKSMIYDNIKATGFADCDDNQRSDADDIAFGIECAKVSCSGQCLNCSVPCAQETVPESMYDTGDGLGFLFTACDLNSNGVADDCEDCNANSRLDPFDIEVGTCLGTYTGFTCVAPSCTASGGITTNGACDCNSNGIPDECDIAPKSLPSGGGNNPRGGTAQDCNTNTMPDSCEIAAGSATDCNSNGIPDACDISSGIFHDCQSNGTPDVCEIANCPTGNLACADCNRNGISDECELAGNDVNGNSIPDDCDTDCDNNGTPDDVDILTDPDLNGNGIIDVCDPDCNGNTIPDDLDISGGTSADDDHNGVPDECECITLRGDADGDCDVDEADNQDFQICFQDGGVTPNGCHCSDIDNDGDVDLDDGDAFSALVASSGPNNPLTNCLAIPEGQIQQWLRTDLNSNGVTTLDFSSNAIPADFFYPGSDPFNGTITFGGTPVDVPVDFGSNGVGDTNVILSHDPISTNGLPTVPVEMVALNLVSTSPITVTGTEANQDWLVSVVLADSQPGGGSISILTRTANGGTYDISVNVNLRAIFVREADLSIPMLHPGGFARTEMDLGTQTLTGADEGGGSPTFVLNSDPSDMWIVNPLAIGSFIPAECDAVGGGCPVRGGITPPRKLRLSTDGNGRAPGGPEFAIQVALPGSAGPVNSPCNYLALFSLPLELSCTGVAPDHPNLLTGPDCAFDGDCPAFMVISRDCSDGGRSMQFYEQDTINVPFVCFP